MSILKSYAHQVVSYHPEKARDDMFNELYNELCEEFDDWHSEHPDGDEVAFLNAEKDHPMRFATRLAPEGSAYLIGPQFYYSFISALKVATVVTIGFHLFFSAIGLIGSDDYFSAITKILFAVPASLLWIYACIIGVFIALEKSGERATWLDNWSASKLNPIESHQPISKTEIFTDLGVSLLGLLWLLGIIPVPFMVRLDGAWMAAGTANLPDVAWVVIGIILVLDIAYCIYRLVKNFWSPRLRYISIFLNIVWIAMLSYVANQPQLITLNEIGVAQIGNLQPLISKVLIGVLYGVIILLVLDTINHGWKLLRSR